MLQRLWKPPVIRKASASRTATWNELFYDLAFVVTIGIVAHELSKNFNWTGVTEYLITFATLWWAWAGFTFYSDRFDTDDVIQRLLTLAQITALILMGIFAPGALNGNYFGFSLAYIAVRLVIILSYFRAYLNIKEVRPLVGRFMIGFSVGLIPWIIGPFIPNELIRNSLIILGLAVELVTPVLFKKQQQLAPLNYQHLPERFGLFTIIVIEQILASAAIGGTDVLSNNIRGIIGVFMGVTIAFTFWWIYFENLDGSVFKKSNPFTFIWIYTHLPLLGALAALSVGVEKGIQSVLEAQSPELATQILFISWAVILFCLSLIDFATTYATENLFREFRSVLLRIILGLIFIGLFLLKSPLIGVELSMLLIVFSGVIIGAVDYYNKKDCYYC